MYFWQILNIQLARNEIIIHTTEWYHLVIYDIDLYYYF